MNGIKLQAIAEPWSRGVAFLLSDVSNGRRSIAINVVFQTEDAANTYPVEPTFRLDIPSAQALMDDLWHAGIRPSDGTGSVGQLAATQAHLEDMRRLVFNGERKT